MTIIIAVACSLHYAVVVFLIDKVFNTIIIKKHVLQVKKHYAG